MGSKRFSLNLEDGKRIMLGLSIALAGAFLTYFTDLIPNVDFGVFTPLVVAGFGVLANAGRKWIKDYSDN